MILKQTRYVRSAENKTQTLKSLIVKAEGRHVLGIIINKRVLTLEGKLKCFLYKNIMTLDKPKYLYRSYTSIYLDITLSNIFNLLFFF